MFKYTYHIATISSLAMSASGLANPALANTSEEIITITAERTTVAELDSPYSTTLIYEDKMAKQGIRTTIDALGNVSGVLLQKTAHGQGSPYIRGFTGFRNVFLIDGVRLNNAVFREGPNQYWNTIDPFSIGRFEVVKGPTSVAYGSDAIGGTVNALTQYQTFDELNTEADIKLIYRGSTAEQSHTVRASYAKKISKESGVSLGFTGKDFGNLIAGGDTNEQPDTGYDEFNIDFKWFTELSNTLQMTTAYLKTKQFDVPRTHKTQSAISFAGSSIGSEVVRDQDQNRELLYVKLDSTAKTTWSDHAQLTLSHHNQSEERYRLRSRNRTDTQGIDVDTLGINLNIAKQIAQHNLVYGFEYYLDNVDSFSSRNEIQGPVGDDSEYQWFGLYGQTKYQINKEFTVDFGTRWSYMSLDANKVQDPQTGNTTTVNESWDNVVFNLRGNYQLTEKEKSLYFGVSQGFRAPNLSDLTRFDTARSNEFEIPSPDVEPEHFLTFDTGIKHRSDTFNYDLSLYYTKIEDQIQRVPTGNTNQDGEFEITKKNLGDGYAYGGEADLSYLINPQLMLKARIAYINGKVDTFPTSDNVLVREYISRVMPTNIYLGLQYTAPSESWWLHSSVTAFEAGDRLSTRDRSDTQRIPPGGTPGFAVWNVGGGYNLSDNMLLTLNLNNLLDKNYRVHGSGQNEAGRNLIGHLTWQF